MGGVLSTKLDICWTLASFLRLSDMLVVVRLKPSTRAAGGVTSLHNKNHNDVIQSMIQNKMGLT